MVFLVSGLMAGLAGILITASGLPVVGPTGQTIWILAPLAAAMVGGASVRNGTGNLRTATIGAALVATTNWLTAELRMPISGPVVAAIYLGGSLLVDRSKNLTWYQINQLRRGNLLALPSQLRLPTILPTVRLPRIGRLGVVLALLTVSAAAYAYIGFYTTRHVPRASAMITSTAGLVEIWRAGEAGSTAGYPGDTLRTGDRIATGFKSQAILRFSDRSHLTLEGSTNLTLTELTEMPDGTRTTRLYVQLGTLLARVAQLVGARSEFSVDSPMLAVAVRGTLFYMVVERTRGYVEVLAGEVEVTRRYLETEPRTGQRYTQQEIAAVSMGQWIEALRDRHLGQGQLLSDYEQEQIEQMDEQITAQIRRGLRNPGMWRGYLGVILMVLLLYLFFTYIQPPPPPFSPDDIAATVQRLEETRTRSPEDSANAAALAHIYLNLGDVDSAQAELRGIVEVDPDSEFGRWALRVLTELQSRRRG